MITNDLDAERGTLSIQGGPGGPGLQDGTRHRDTGYGRDRKGLGVENAFRKELKGDMDGLGGSENQDTQNGKIHGFCLKIVDLLTTKHIEVHKDRTNDAEE